MQFDCKNYMWACGLKSLTLADSEVVTARMPQVWKYGLP